MITAHGAGIGTVYMCMMYIFNVFIYSYIIIYTYLHIIYIIICIILYNILNLIS